MKKTGLAGIVAVLAVACDNAGMAGAWVQPIPGQEERVQGIVLNEDGTASSINMSTLRYESWKQDGDRLILSGKSVGNGQTISFSDTVTVYRLDADTLVVGSPNFKQVYSRMK